MSDLFRNKEKSNKLTPEVDVVWEAMTCRAMRNYYESKTHKCTWFHKYGPYHAYDVNIEDSLSEPEGYVSGFYVGKRYQIPELLSGCRKAPIMSIGLNPNLRGEKDRKRIYPYFDDIYQYSKHFRYRTNYKYSIETEEYKKHYSNEEKDAFFEIDQNVDLKKSYVSMYNEYNKILESFTNRIGIRNDNLCLGEDVSYYNFVICHSPRWNMNKETENGIVEECFAKRKFFINQLLQSKPKILILFGKAIMKNFVHYFENNFIGTDIPDPNNKFDEIMKGKYYLILNEHKVCVIFSTHPTGNRPLYNKINAQERIVNILENEYLSGNIKYNSDTKHLARDCENCCFCDNDLFKIGECKYN